MAKTSRGFLLFTMLIIYIYLSVAKYAFVSVYFVKPIYIASMNEIYTKHMRTPFILVHMPLLLDSNPNWSRSVFLPVVITLYTIICRAIAFI